MSENIQDIYRTCPSCVRHISQAHLLGGGAFMNTSAGSVAARRHTRADAQTYKYKMNMPRASMGSTRMFLVLWRLGSNFVSSIRRCGDQRMSPGFRRSLSVGCRVLWRCDIVGIGDVYRLLWHASRRIGPSVSPVAGLLQVCSERSAVQLIATAPSAADLLVSPHTLAPFCAPPGHGRTCPHHLRLQRVGRI